MIAAWILLAIIVSLPFLIPEFETQEQEGENYSSTNQPGLNT
jgi:hypothetical protein